MSNILFIDTPAELENFASGIANREWLALDTEFLRERTYRPELCLLQIATPDTVACVDPLALESIDPLLDILYKPNIIKVFHAASQDLEIFYWLRGEVPANLFDTQIAAPLLGYQEQIGYGNLVSEVLNVALSKSHSRADWTRRPLPKQQVQYAADDVIYLARMYPIIRDKLDSLNRLQWLDSEWNHLVNPDLYEKPADEVWRRLRGIDKLKGGRLAVAQQLAKWRELTARDRNLPRSWLVKDDVLMDLAKQSPRNTGELKHIRGLNDGVIKSHGSKIIDCINQSKDNTPVQPDNSKRKVKLTPDQDAALDLLTAVAKIHARELEINASLLAPRKSIEDLIRGKSDTAVMQGWRGQLIGPALQSVLAGEASLKIDNGAAVIE